MLAISKAFRSFVNLEKLILSHSSKKHEDIGNFDSLLESIVLPSKFQELTLSNQCSYLEMYPSLAKKLFSQLRILTFYSSELSVL